MSSETSSNTICTMEYKELSSDDKRCAPSKKIKHGSCIPLDTLIILAEAFNKYIDKNENTKERKIKLDNKYRQKCESNYKQYILKKLSVKIKNCNNQKCWIKQDFINNIDKKKFGNYLYDLKTNTFRPEGPQGNFKWLDTNNINKVMAQYEYKYPNFKFLEAVPMDFATLPYYNHFDENSLMNYYKNNKYKFGVVFNLDFSHQSGSHWVALYTDIKLRQILFSDSVGNAPHKNVLNFMKVIRNVMNNVHNNSPQQSEIIVKINDKKHQRGGSECGVYSLHFIVTLLESADPASTFEQIYNSNERITDEQITTFRKIFFTKE